MTLLKKPANGINTQPISYEGLASNFCELNCGVHYVYELLVSFLLTQAVVYGHSISSEFWVNITQTQEVNLIKRE